MLSFSFFVPTQLLVSTNFIRSDSTVILILMFSYFLKDMLSLYFILIMSLLFVGVLETHLYDNRIEKAQNEMQNVHNELFSFFFIL